jgi:hypothetical protein
MRLVIRGGSGSASRIDSTILKATARARRWFDDLVTGRAASMIEIGQREGVGKRYVSRMIRLAFLAHAIVERIAEGRQPPGTHCAVSVHRSRRSSTELASPGETARLRRSSLIAPPPRKILPGLLQYFRFQFHRIDEFLRRCESAEVHRANGQWIKIAKIAPRGVGRASLRSLSTANTRARAVY